MVEDDVHSLGLRGIRSLAVAKTNSNGDWEMVGYIQFIYLYVLFNVCFLFTIYLK